METHTLTTYLPLSGYEMPTRLRHREHKRKEGPGKMCVRVDVTHDNKETQQQHPRSLVIQEHARLTDANKGPREV